MSNKSRYFQFFLIVLAAGSIFPIMYLRQSYQETMLEVFGITLEQLNIIYTFLGIAFVVGYFPSGIISDKFSAKKLLALSLFGTSLGGFWFAQIPSYGFVIACFVIWGIFSIFTFWSAHMKLVKLLARKEEEGRFFGILDGGRGAVEALLAMVAVAIFGFILHGSEALPDKRSALVAVIYLYSFVLLAMSILVMIFVKEDKDLVGVKDDLGAVDNCAVDNCEGEAKLEQKFQFSDLREVFRNPTIFLLGAIIFFGYIVTWTFYYLGGYMQANMGIDAVTVGVVMAVCLWMRPVGGILGGFLADKIGRENTLRGALLLGGIGLVLISILPHATTPMLMYAIIILLSIFIFMIRGTYWSLLGKCLIEDRITGVAIGSISLFGYLPDIVLPLFINVLFARFGDEGGYNAYFIFSAIMGVASIALIFAFIAASRRRRAMLDGVSQR